MKDTLPHPWMTHHGNFNLVPRVKTKSLNLLKSIHKGKGKFLPRTDHEGPEGE